MMISTEYFCIAKLVQLPILILLLTMGSHHTKPVCMGIFKICTVVGKRTVFSRPRSVPRADIKRLDMDPNVPERLLRP
jgi:hypothetical protein